MRPTNQLGQRSRIGTAVGPGVPGAARELVALGVGVALAAEQAGQVGGRTGNQVDAEDGGRRRRAVGPVGRRQAGQEARRVDRALGGEADEAAGGRGAGRLRGDDEGGRVELAHHGGEVAGHA